MDHEQIFERLWSGVAAMEEWTQAVSTTAATLITDNIIAVHSTYFCGSVTAIRTAVGLVLIDTASAALAGQTLAEIRRWDESAVHTVVYTHGHIDHTGGMRAIDEDADARGIARPRIVAHRAVGRRLDRYAITRGFNSLVHGQQFNYPNYSYPVGQRKPDQVYDNTLSLIVGGERIELIHGRGETDDATFVWLPDKRVLVSGDFVIWMFPNAGNPRKVQRYAAEWATVLRRMQDLKPEVLIPGHGPVIFGASRVGEVLGDAATLLESLVEQTLAMMNRGCTLDEVLRGVSAPTELLMRPYLLPKYDDPEFVVRAIWHLNGGWFDGNPAHLKPAADDELAAELAALAGGALRVAERAVSLAEAGHTRLAASLVEIAAGAAVVDKAVQAMRAQVLERCVAQEGSLMGKAFFAAYARNAKALTDNDVRSGSNTSESTS
jgi:alkyl sulfatase BDS1-like metallo-beta-lactamase superfamily hydrolase